MSNESKIVQAALAARTVSDALSLQSLLKTDLGGEFYRPLGDTWNNHGLMGSSGSYDFKLIELATNMQDGVLELLALRKHGSPHKVPYANPHEAAADLLSHLTDAEKAQYATVTFTESDPPASKSKKLTAVFRDHGCGLTPDALPRTVFRLGGSHKEDALYLQGAFGLGGAMTYRNAAAVVLVTRRDPSLLREGVDDRIAVAVVEWRDNTKGTTAMYLVDNQWDEPGDDADPWSCDAGEYPDFAPGTHLAMISYRVDGFQRKTERDEKSFNSVTDTRLFDPVIPLLFTNETDRGRKTVLKGLRARLDSASPRFPTESETLPYHFNGVTYHLPVTFTMFEARRQAGGADKFVASDHAVIFTSNGQVHHHWSPLEFRNRTGFNKIYDRVLIVVETDELPIRLRTSLFTADRNDIVRGDAALRLEEAVIGFVKEWDALKDQNSQLIRDALRSTGDQKTMDLARKIGRAFQAAGFGGSVGENNTGNGRGSGAGKGSSGGSGGRSPKEIPLHQDPTRIEGPRQVKARVGETRSLTFVVDVVDSFYDARGELTVRNSHPDLTEREITVGKGRKGRVRVMLVIPETASLGTYTLEASLAGWFMASGGLGRDLSWTVNLEVVEEIDGQGVGGGKRNSGRAAGGDPSAGNDIALRWINHEQPGWAKMTVGQVERVPAKVLADEIDDYKALASLGDRVIPTITLNEDYPLFKKYIETRSKALTSLERPRDQYAYGVGLALLVLNAEVNRRIADNIDIPDDQFLEEAQRAAARAVLAVMPAFDDLAREAGLCDS